jgi:hypothetical protein
MRNAQLTEVPDMPHLRRTGLLAITSIALCLGITSARADIVAYTGANPLGTENVLLNPSANVLAVTGVVGPENLTVRFTSSSGSSLLNSSLVGQAAISGGTGNNPFTELTIDLAGDDTFTRGVFNINAATDGQVEIRVYGIGIFGAYFSANFFVNDAGDNFFTIDAINNQFIQSISLIALNGATFEDVRQVRLGGGDVSAPTEVPEPGTTLLLAFGLAGIAFTARRRRRI